MKVNYFNLQTYLVALAISALAGMTITAQAQTGFTDSLINDSTLNYVWTPLNFAGTGSSGTTVSFASTASGLQVDSSDFAGTAVQGVYFNNTGASLPVGDMLTISIANWTSGGSEDFGIAVGNNATPTAAIGDGSDVRSGTAYIYNAIRVSAASPNGHVTGGGSDGASGLFFSPTLQVQNQPTILSLAISHDSASTFSLYYDEGSGYTLLGSRTFASSGVGTTIGFYADVRGSGSPQLGDLVNFAVVPVPEPATVALCGIGFVGLLALKRRK